MVAAGGTATKLRPAQNTNGGSRNLRLFILWCPRPCRMRWCQQLLQPVVPELAHERNAGRSRRNYSYRSARNHVPRRTAQQTPCPCHHLGQDAQTLGPAHRWRPRQNGNVPLRSGESPHRLAPAITPMVPLPGDQAHRPDLCRRKGEPSRFCSEKMEAASHSATLFATSAVPSPIHRAATSCSSFGSSRKLLGFTRHSRAPNSRASSISASFVDDDSTTTGKY